MVLYCAKETDSSLDGKSELEFLFKTHIVNRVWINSLLKVTLHQNLPLLLIFSEIH